MLNESFIVENGNATELRNFYLSSETKSEIYRKYLQNLNYTQNSSESARSYARMMLLVPENFSIVDGDMDFTTELNPNDLPFTITHSHIIVIVLIVIYATIFVLGVLGNVVTCIVIAKNRSMHTAVNFYLFSLAISDVLLLLIALPEEVYLLWFPEYPFGEIVCKFHKFAAESFTNATVFTITAFTIERYVAICKPFLSHTLSKLSRACKFILGIWVLSIALAIPQTLFTLHIDKDFHMCIPRTETQHYFAISTFLIFVIPMSVITVLYILIGLQLRKSKIVQRGNINGSSVRLKRKIFNNKPTNQTLVIVNSESHYNDALLHHNNDINRNYSKNNFIEPENMSIPEDGRINYSTNRSQVHHGSKHVVKMLVVVVIAFAACWSPFHLQRLLFSYIEPYAMNRDLSFCINYVSGVLFFVSTCINPFLYNIMSNKFREAFKVTISKYIYGSPHQEKGKTKICRTFSQRSYSMNSTSLNTCSSICSMQPFSTHQQTFRYFSDSKRPLVVSFRRVNKVKLPHAPEKHSDRCNSICDIHRVVECDGNDSKMSLKSRHGRHLSSYKIDSQMFHVDMMRQRTHFDNEEEESPRRDKRTVTYPKEKFHGNAKLLFTINDDILKHDRHWYDSINATSNSFTATTLSQKPRKSYYRNEIDKTRKRADDDEEIRNTNKLRFAHKSTSTPSLSKLEKSHSNDIDFEMKERKQCFISFVHVRGNEKKLIKNSKSY